MFFMWHAKQKTWPGGGLLDRITLQLCNIIGYRLWTLSFLICILLCIANDLGHRPLCGQGCPSGVTFLAINAADLPPGDVPLIENILSTGAQSANMGSTAVTRLGQVENLLVNDNIEFEIVGS